MISDTLSDAVREIDEYLESDPLYEIDHYPAHLLAMIHGVRNHMDAVRFAMDAVSAASISQT